VLTSLRAREANNLLNSVKFSDPYNRQFISYIYIYICVCVCVCVCELKGDDFI